MDKIFEITAKEVTVHGERQRKEKQRTSYLQHLCAKDFLVRGRTDLRFEYSAAGRGVSSLVGSA